MPEIAYGNTCTYSKPLKFCHTKLLLLNVKALQLYKSVFIFQFTTTTTTTTTNNNNNNNSNNNTANSTNIDSNNNIL